MPSENGNVLRADVAVTFNDNINHNRVFFDIHGNNTCAKSYACGLRGYEVARVASKAGDDAKFRKYSALGDRFVQRQFAPIGFETTGVNSIYTDQLFASNLSHIINQEYIVHHKVSSARYWYEKRLSFIVANFNYKIFNKFQMGMQDANANTNIVQMET